MKTLLVWLLCAVALVILLTNCGQKPTPEEQEEALRRQVERWWGARQLRDHDTVCEMYEPAYRARAKVNITFSFLLPRLGGVAATSGGNLDPDGRQMVQVIQADRTALSSVLRPGKVNVAIISTILAPVSLGRLQG